MNVKKHVFLILKIIVSLSILAFLFREADVGNVLSIILSMDFPLFLLAVFLQVVAQTVYTYRWSLFLPNAGIDMPFLRLVSLYYIGMFFNIFLPTVVGGDVVKVYYLYRLSGKGGNSMASVFLDRFTGFFALVIIAFTSLLLGYKYVENTDVPFSVITLTVMFFLMALIIWNRSLHNWALLIISRIKMLGINEKIESLYNAVMLYKGEPRVLLKAVGTSFVVQVLSVTTFYVISKGLGMKVPIGYFFIFVPIAVTISMLPISLSGLGLREGAFVYLFTKVGATDAQALTVSLVYFAAMVLLGLIGGIEYVRLGSAEKYPGFQASESQGVKE